MTKIQQFKEHLARVFDDNLKTNQWYNIIDWTIIALIIISTIEIFASTFESVNKEYHGLLHVIDVVTTIVFTIELVLRTWVADKLDSKYKGFWGRVRYSFSFYGMIDILSTIPFYLAFIFPWMPATLLKSLRVARLLRIFRYMTSFKLLKDAICSKKDELVISIQFLFVVTIILSFIMFFVEHAAQPKVYDNGWTSAVWAFCQYIGDPGHFAENPPITFIGRLIACCVGILGIAIFAVPAGLIGSGFVECVEDRKHRKEIEDNTEKLEKAFERKLCRYTRFQIAPPFVSFADIQARLHMKVDDIIDTANESPNFRIINTAATIPVDKSPKDNLAVEHFPVNRTYGCCIDRNSKITIISPASFADPVIGFFSYYLAKMGGFNYISREIGETKPYKSFYMTKPGNMPEHFDDFMNDVNFFADKNGAWTITLLAASGANEPEYPHQLHIGYGGAKGDSTFEDKEHLLVHDTDTAEQLFSNIETVMLDKFEIKTDRQQYHLYTNPNLYLRKINNKDNVNSIVFRMAWSMTCWDSRRMLIAQTLAEILNKNLEPDVEKEISPDLKIKDIGYRGYEL